jgi:sulfopyruvate decarboxylase TPP-binding subunit
VAQESVKPHEADWLAGIHRALVAAGVRIVGYVPDAGHKRLIELCQADRKMRSVVLTIEEEGVGLAAGAWLGGEKCALFMQSSGVGNVINVLGMAQECRVPLVTLVTMRGQQGEFNPWQVPMGQATRPALEAMGTIVHCADSALRETGMQATHTASGVDLAGVALACGFKDSTIVVKKEEIESLQKTVHGKSGPNFAAVKVIAEKLPLVLPPREGALLKARFRRALLGDAADSV